MSDASIPIRRSDRRRPRLRAAGWAALIVFASTGAAAAGGEIGRRFDPGGRLFQEIEIGDWTVYFHQRTIGEAIVEKDFIVYRFDRKTGALLRKKEHWRTDLPDELPALGVSRIQAEALTGGAVQFSKLYYISPESNVFPIDPTPRNPCWVVASASDGRTTYSVIDAVGGKKLGYGVPPPAAAAFSLTGPTGNTPCSGFWWDWSNSAKVWFERMGYPTDHVIWPAESQVQAHVQDPAISLFYETAHGGSTYFSSGCSAGQAYEDTTAIEVRSWIAPYRKMPFAFIASCDGLCDTTSATFSYEFRKGSMVDTATVGYCDMSSTACNDCWVSSIPWQNALFEYMVQGETVKQAFDLAMADFPSCAGTNNCMRFAGDAAFEVADRLPGVRSGSADYNGDRQDEIGVFRNGMWFSTYSPDYSGVDRTTAFGSPVPGSDAPEIGEFGCVPAGGGWADGKTDIAILRRAFSTWQVTLSPDWGSSADLTVVFGTTGHKRLPLRRMDTNGDRCSDFGVFRNGCFDVLESPGYGSIGTHVCFGPGTDEPLAADLDADRKSDLILWRAATSHYTYRLSSESFAADHGSDLGGGDLALIGDVNGDGAADLGSFKQLYATFRFVHSPDFAGVDLVKTHGMNGDLPLVAEVNGDGVADIGIFRNAIARWWFLCSPGWTTACVSQSFGQPGDVPIYGKPHGMP